MDSNQRTGIGIILLGIVALSSAANTFVSSTASDFLFFPAAMAVSGFCLTSMGVGILLGKFETTDGTESKRDTALIALVAIASFAVGILLFVA